MGTVKSVADDGRSWEVAKDGVLCELRIVLRADDELERETAEVEMMGGASSVRVWAVVVLKFLERLMLEIEDIAVDVAKANEVVIKLVESEAVELRGAANDDDFGGIVVDVKELTDCEAETEWIFSHIVVFENSLDGLIEVTVCEAETEAMFPPIVVSKTRLVDRLNGVAVAPFAVVFEIGLGNDVSEVAVCEVETGTIVTC